MDNSGTNTLNTLNNLNNGGSILLANNNHNNNNNTTNGHQANNSTNFYNLSNIQQYINVILARCFGRLGRRRRRLSSQFLVLDSSCSSCRYKSGDNVGLATITSIVVRSWDHDQ